MQPWQTLTSRPLLDRAPWLIVWEEDVRLANGLVIEGYTRSRGRDYSMVFAVQTNGTGPLVRQYKHGVGEPLYDLPAGYLDSPDEAPLAAAQRELREETGLVADRWQELGHLVIDTNRGPDQAHIYLALDAHLDGPQELDPGEAIEVSYHTPAELRDMVLRGEITSMASVAGIMMAWDVLRAT
ncbi:MAG: NUDIX hydrolase [Chloroflexi bacterium]|nr:NUDIX hydrolase [Chloroflexota bacterium]